MSLLKIEKLSVEFNKKTILSDVNLQVNKGEIVGLIGVNGSGKTTLLKAICNSISYDGNCFIEDDNIKNLSARKLARVCSYIPQTTGISIDISVLNVVLMGANPFMNLFEEPDQTLIEKAREYIKKVGLSGREEFNFMKLSEGQKQLCIIARSMMADTRLVLMDEPESALDFNMRHKMMGLLRDWINKSDNIDNNTDKKRANDSDKGMLITLHDINMALEFCDRLLILHDGCIIQQLCPQKENIQDMENKLKSIYEGVKLLEYQDAAGFTKVVMVNDKS